MSTLVERIAAPQSVGVLVARTNFRVRSPEARHWILTELTDDIQSSKTGSIRKAEFRATSVPSILELELHIASETFVNAERVAQNFVSSVGELIDNRVQATEMSTGIYPE